EYYCWLYYSGVQGLF
nr:immunoglobulin light chain junction region [Macaca mulatta]MOW14912.1 immunoglobulin light chain junction region [Macaca mulatta]MOW14928.1 immunoglobulin light chain junction region [Macaca mulatta]MOW14966.1 immunoglobulin light chain junction region [Macaca mulatta]MOW15016.1 immunoglobulin light chain junction region [Macaca mulatta]